MPDSKCPEDGGGEEGRPGGHLHASLSSASSLHAGLCQDRSSPQVSLPNAQSRMHLMLMEYVPMTNLLHLGMWH